MLGPTALPLSQLILPSLFQSQAPASLRRVICPSPPSVLPLRSALTLLNLLHKLVNPPSLVFHTLATSFFHSVTARLSSPFFYRLQSRRFHSFNAHPWLSDVLPSCLLSTTFCSKPRPHLRFPSTFILHSYAGRQFSDDSLVVNSSFTPTVDRG